MIRFPKRAYNLCEGDTVNYTPTGQLGSKEKAKELWDKIFDEGLEVFRD